MQATTVNGASMSASTLEKTSSIATPVSDKQLWAGRAVTALVILFLVFDSAVKLVTAKVAVEATVRLGYPESVLFGLGVVLLSCTLLYLLPRTSILGAVLLTGYLGGATATHVRIGDPFYFPIVVGLLVWAGVYLRNPRLRELFPIQS
ncbi:MAG TPA: DoxX family protein [Bryobacteraceae bacterium]|nr:DoxX family protein [Bryobacteraceae bacterium]